MPKNEIIYNQVSERIQSLGRIIIDPENKKVLWGNTSIDLTETLWNAVKVEMNKELPKQLDYKSHNILNWSEFPVAEEPIP